MEKTSWYGIEIIDILRVKNLKIIFGKDSLVFILKDADNREHLINLYLSLNFFLSYNIKIRQFFALFLNNEFNFKRKKIKNSIVENNSLNIIDLLALTESSNADVYYEFIQDNTEFVGLELRLEDDTVTTKFIKEDHKFKLLEYIRANYNQF